MSFLFIYKTSLFGTKRSPSVVIKGSREWMEQYIPLTDFPSLFGGYALWRGPSKQNAMMPGEALGVWGKRNASKLRRILRERGAEFRVVKGEGPEQQIAILSQHKNIE